MGWSLLVVIWSIATGANDVVINDKMLVLVGSARRDKLGTRDRQGCACQWYGNNDAVRVTRARPLETAMPSSALRSLVQR